VPALNKLYESYRDRVAFYVVYIQEAHPSDVWQMESNVKDGVLFASARSDEERTATASACVRNLGIKIPAILDGIENKTERAYTGWPDRLYLVGTDGRVKFKTQPGPYGFSTQGLEQALQNSTSTSHP
jgi:type I thyroxine 5'-deiodinase